jgi:hypothetical protein
MDRARAELDDARSDQLYGRSARRLLDQQAMVFIADVKDFMVVRSDLTGLSHAPNYPWTLDMRQLRRR